MDLLGTAASQALPGGGQVATALAAAPGATGWPEHVMAQAPDNPVRVTVTRAPVGLALDHVTGEALRAQPEGATWNAWPDEVHGTLVLGWVGDRLPKVAAGLGIVMVATRLQLWWPGGAGAGFRTSATLLALLVTGMAWTGM